MGDGDSVSSTLLILLVVPEIELCSSWSSPAVGTESLAYSRSRVILDGGGEEGGVSCGA